MNDLIEFFVWFTCFQLEVLGIFLRDATKYFFSTSAKSLEKDDIPVTGGPNGIQNNVNLTTRDQNSKTAAEIHVIYGDVTKQINDNGTIGREGSAYCRFVATDLIAPSIARDHSRDDRDH